MSQTVNITSVPRFYEMTVMKRLSTTSFGHGPIKVIALHGWFGDETTFSPLFRALDPDQFHWVSPALRGYGASRHLQGAYTMQEVAEDVLALADDLGWERFNLIGHSMGGKAIQRVLANAPHRIAKLIGVTPVPASGVPFDDGMFGFFQQAWSNPEAALGIVTHSVGGRLPKRYIEEIATHPHRVASEASFLGYLNAWAKGDFSAELAGISLPVKVIVGEHDGAITADFMRGTFLAHFPNGELETMPNAGHYPMDETPLALAASIIHFLAG